MTTDQEQLNRFTDSTWSWWPFLSLRPKKEEFMPAKSVFWATTIFTAGLAFGGLMMRAVASLDVPLTKITLGLLIAWPCFYFFYRATFVRAWNARAEELNRPK
jgi:hypothetical protein